MLETLPQSTTIIPALKLWRSSVSSTRPAHAVGVSSAVRSAPPGTRQAVRNG